MRTGLMKRAGRILSASAGHLCAAKISKGRYHLRPTSDDEKEAWDATEWDEDGNVPRRVEAAAVNKWLFNEDTVDKVLQHLMTHGIKVAGGDRLGKTIIFAKNHDHAEYIAKRFDANYPTLKVRSRGLSTSRPSMPSRLSTISVSRTRRRTSPFRLICSTLGSMCPRSSTSCFFKIVRSKTKFWQMIGRGTRLCPDLFGPGKHKDHFLVFDFCQNLEFFNQNLPTTEGAAGIP